MIAPTALLCGGDSMSCMDWWDGNDDLTASEDMAADTWCPLCTVQGTSTAPRSLQTWPIVA